TALRPSDRKDVGARRRKEIRQGDSYIPDKRLGHLAAALLGNADSDGALRQTRRGADRGERLAGDSSGQSAGHAFGWIAANECAGVPEHDLSEMWRPGAARDRHHGYVRRFVVVLLPLRRRAE